MALFENDEFGWKKSTSKLDEIRPEIRDFSDELRVTLSQI
jgi:hypothetical protein